VVWAARRIGVEDDGPRRGGFGGRWGRRFRGGKGFGFFGFGLNNGFVRQLVAEGAEALEFLDGAAVKTLGLGLVAEKQRPTAGAMDLTNEPIGQATGVDLRRSAFEGRGTQGADGFIHAGGEKAGFQGGAAQERLLGKSDALDGEEFLGVDGLVDGDEVGLEVGDGVEFFETDDGEIGGGEAMLTGVLRGAGFAFGGARAGGMSCVLLIRGEARGRNGLTGLRHRGILRFQR